MATNWSVPALSQAWADFLAAIKGRDESLAKLDYTGDTNIPDGAIRWNASSNRFEIWSVSGSTWGALTATYAIDVDTVDGQHASAFAPVGHVGATGSAHGVATTGVAGFMSAADKTILNAATSAATANTLAKRDASGRLQAAAPSASADVVRKAETDALSASLAAHKAAGGSEHPAVTTAAAGFMSAADKQKLDGLVQGAFTEYFASAEQTITFGATVTVAHGLSGKPRGMMATIICKTAEHGYSVGDEVVVSDFQRDSGTTGFNKQLSLGFDGAGNVFAVYGSTHIVIATKSGGTDGTITPANWRLIVRAWR